MLYLLFFVLSVMFVSFYTFFEMAYILSSKERAFMKGKIAEFLRKPEEVIITVLMGTNLWAIAASIFFRKFMGKSGGGEIIEGGLLVTIILFIFSEMLPKNVATYKYREFFPFVAPLIWWTYLIFSPVVKAMEIVMRRFYGKSKSIKREKERDVIAYIAETRKEIPDSDVEMHVDVIEETVRFLASPVIDYSLGLKDICFINADSPDYLRAKKSDFSLVYKGTIDNIIGVLKGKYIYPLQKGYFVLEQVLEEPIFVHENQSVKKVINELWESGKREAIVVDEHGNIKGTFSTGLLRNVILKISRGHFVTLWGTDSVERLAKLCGKVNTIDMQKSLHEFLLERLNGELKEGSTLYLEECRITIISMERGVVGKVIVEARRGRNES